MALLGTAFYISHYFISTLRRGDPLSFDLCILPEKAGTDLTLVSPGIICFYGFEYSSLVFKSGCEFSDLFSVLLSVFGEGGGFSNKSTSGVDLF
jgi:hypothetical protein